MRGPFAGKLIQTKWWGSAILAALLCGASLLEAAEGQVVDVLLRLESQTITVISQRVYPGTVPRSSRGDGRVGDWLIEAQASKGRTLAVSIIPDPFLLYADGLDEHASSPGQLTGGMVRASQAVALVRLPYDVRITRLKLSRIRAAVSARSAHPLELIGTVSIELGVTREGGAASGATYASETLIDHGPSANRVDLVFLGDGYTRARLPKFRQDVQLVLNELLGQPPLNNYARYFNVHVVDVVSRDSGIDHPNVEEPKYSIFRDTALDMTYNFAGVPDCIYSTRPQRITEAAQLAPQPADIILVLVNDIRYGGCSSSPIAVAAMSRNGYGPATLAHEFGHAFGLMGDEYVRDPPSHYKPEYGEPDYLNLTIQTQRPLIKWNVWMPEGIPLPTFDPTQGFPAGLYEGGFTFQTGIFRSTYTSRMADITQPWSVVQMEALIHRLYGGEFVNPIDKVEPSEAVVELNTPGPRTFRITPMERCCGPLQIVWFINGQKITLATDSEFQITRTNFSPGTYQLAVEVTDDTPFVRNVALKEALTRRMEWTLEVPMLHRPTITLQYDEATVEVGQNLFWQVTVQDPDGGRLKLDTELPGGVELERVLVDQSGRFAQEFSWTPSDETQIGTHRLIFTATDEDGLEQTQTMTVTVRPANHPPVLAPMTEQVVEEGRLLDFYLIASDPDGDPLTFSTSTPHEDMFIEPSSGHVRWIPWPDESGMHEMVFEVSDGRLTSQQSLRVRILDRLASISGTIRASDGRPVAGVPVSLELGRVLRDANGRAMVSRTDATGRFRFFGLELQRRVQLARAQSQRSGKTRVVKVRVVPRRNGQKFLSAIAGGSSVSLMLDPLNLKDERADFTMTHSAPRP